MAPTFFPSLKVYVICSFLFLVVFLGIYPACNAITAHRAAPLALYFPWELGIPFVPSFIWIYGSMILLWPLQPFLLGPHEIKQLTWKLLTATLVSGACFLLLPAHLGFSRQLPSDPLLSSLFQGLFQADQPHNLVPSLHVANSALILFAFTKRTNRLWLRGLWAMWLALIAASTLLVHQHHLLDVISGLGLAIVIQVLLSGPGLGKAKQPLSKGSE